MTKLNNSTLIQIVHPICCGVGVHKDKISACLITVNSDGTEHDEIREFTTFTKDLGKMKKWLSDNHCPVVAMDSTGVYWGWALIQNFAPYNPTTVKIHDGWGEVSG